MKKALSQAKILAIDKNKGRVTLATKNGLISTGTYLYDINDLKVNMTVLVGKVSGTNVIIEKVSANLPKMGALSVVQETSEIIRYIGLEYFNIQSYDDHFDGSSIDSSMWGFTYPYLVYNEETEQFEEQITTWWDPVINEETTVSESRLWLDSPCGASSGVFQKLFCKHTYPAGSNFTVEAGIYISDRVYSARPYTKDGAGTVTLIDYPTIEVRLTKVGKVWSSYYRKTYYDTWHLLESYTKDFTKEDWTCYASITLYAGYSGDVDVEIGEANAGGIIFSPYPESASMRVRVEGSEIL
jgi:hypothetical protein